MVRTVFAEMTTRRSLTSIQEGKKFFDLLSNHTPALQPERYGNWEPLRKRFDPARPEELLSSWEDPFLWTSRKAKVTGWIGHGISPPPSQGEISISMADHLVALSSLVQLNAALAQEFLADFSLIHLLTGPEIERGRQRDVVHFTHIDGRGAFLFVPAIKLRTRYAPDLYWLTLFGPSYVKLFGRECLLSAPVHRIEELPYGGIILQLTADLSDLTTKTAEFEAVRTAALAHLDHDVFFDPAKGPDYEYQRPDFLNREDAPDSR